MICVEIHSNNKLSEKDFVLSNAVSDSVKHETVKFLFPDNWKDFEKTAVFSAEGVDPINVLLDEDSDLCLSSDECYIPFEVLMGDCFYLSVFGCKGESLATTTKTKIKVLESGYALGDKPSEPTQSEYSQMIDIMNETREIAQSVRDDADNGLFNGADRVGVGRATEQGGEIFNDYNFNKAIAPYSSASGQETQALAENSSSNGYRTTAGCKNQFVCGQLNENKEDTLFEVGNGYANAEEGTVLFNAFEVYKDGHAEVQTMGDTDNSVVTKQYVDNAIANSGLSITDDGSGNVTINPVGNISITDDGNGNVTIM